MVTPKIKKPHYDDEPLERMKKYYKVDNDENGQIKSVTISNYRERERFIEIFNTATWVFTRMLEKGI